MANSEPRTSLRFSFMIPKWENNWLVVWNIFYFSIYILGMSSSQLTNSILFQRGRYTTNQIRWVYSWEVLVYGLPRPKISPSVWAWPILATQSCLIFPNGFRIIHSNRRYNRSQGSQSALFETIEIGFQAKNYVDLRVSWMQQSAGSPRLTVSENTSGQKKQNHGSGRKWLDQRSIMTQCTLW